MKFAVHDLHAAKTITITGHEEWLSAIYSDFAVDKSAAKGLLNAELSVSRREEGTSYRVVGSVRFCPNVDCARCGDKLTWPIDTTVDLIFAPDDREYKPGSEVSLALADLETYPLINDTIDIETILNDAIEEAIPLAPVLRDASGTSCKQCGKSLDARVVFGSEQKDPAPSPFAALKDWSTKKS